MLIHLPFPTEIKVAPCLNELDMRWLWEDMQFGLNQDHKWYLIRLINDRWGHRQIGFAERGTFKARVRGRLESVWNEKYQPLFSSVLVANKDNFLFTEDMKSHRTKDESSTYKKYSDEKQGIQTSGAHEQYENATDSRAGKTDSEGFQATGLEEAETFSEKTKEGSLGKHTGTNDDLNTQTPQTVTLAKPLNPDVTGTNAIYATQSDDDPFAGSGTTPPEEDTELPLWNDGILTEATRHNISGQDSFSKQTGHDSLKDHHMVSGVVDGKTGASWEEGFSQTGGGAKNSTASSMEGVSTLTGTTADGMRENFAEAGFRGINISVRLQELRKTFEPFSQAFVMEIANYFLRTF